MFTEPKIEQRPEQPYVGIRFQIHMHAIGPDLFPQLIDELYNWLGERGLEPVGAPILRYYTIDMPSNLDIEIGLPVEAAIPGDNRVTASTLPAGRYAYLVYTGVQNGIEGNRRLLEWGSAQGLTWDKCETPQGDAFGARYETFLDGPEDDPDPANWDNEVAICLADDSK